MTQPPPLLVLRAHVPRYSPLTTGLVGGGIQGTVGSAPDVRCLAPGAAPRPQFSLLYLISVHRVRECRTGPEMVIFGPPTTIVSELIKEALLRCFCNTCRSSPSLDRNKSQPMILKPLVRTRPPRRTGMLMATEVRCTEQSKGGLKYELVLADPCTESPVRKPSSSPPKSISAEDIQKKLKEAEERRQSLEAQKLNQLNEKLSRLAEVNQKREGLEEEFQEATRLSYEKKIEAFKENREAHIKSIQEKQREHVSRVEEVRRSLDAQTQEMLASIQKKIENASEAREAQIAALQERLRNHDKHIVDVRKQLEDLVDEKREKIQKKLETAQENRAAIYRELQVKLQEKEKHAEEVRQNKTQSSEDTPQKNNEQTASG